MRRSGRKHTDEVRAPTDSEGGGFIELRAMTHDKGGGLIVLEDLMDDARQRMQGAIDALDEDLAGFRTGRASPALVERLQVNYYGTPTPLNQLATITIPEPRLIAIRAWDQNAVQAIEKASLSSDLGLTPPTDAQLLRLVIPQLTEERPGARTLLARRRGEAAPQAVATRPASSRPRPR